MAEDIFSSVRKIYENRDKGLTASGQPSRDVKMKSGMSYGMGNTSKSVFGPPKAPMTGGDTLDFLRGMQGTPLGKALAYGVSLVEQSEKKGQPKDRSEYMRLLSGSEAFRKLPPDGQQQVRLGMQQWFQTQSKFNPSKAMQVKKDEELNRQKAGAKQAADMISIF